MDGIRLENCFFLMVVGFYFVLEEWYFIFIDVKSKIKEKVKVKV